MTSLENTLPSIDSARPQKSASSSTKTSSKGKASNGGALSSLDDWLDDDEGGPHVVVADVYDAPPGDSSDEGVVGEHGEQDCSVWLGLKALYLLPIYCFKKSNFHLLFIY